MLLRADTLDAIREGRISQAFRRWRRPTVRTAGTLLTGAGQLEIREVTEVDPDDLTASDAEAAGCVSLEELRAELARREGGRCYRVTESLSTGYRLSPRGLVILEAMRSAGPSGVDPDTPNG